MRLSGPAVGVGPEAVVVQVLTNSADVTSEKYRAEIASAYEQLALQAASAVTSEEVERAIAQLRCGSQYHSRLPTHAKSRQVRSRAFRFPYHEPGEAVRWGRLCGRCAQEQGEATAWLLRNLAGEWAKHDIAKGLKEKGIYDPETIAVSASPLPEPPADVELPSVSEILKLEGDAAQGKAAAARCIPCHKIDGNGTDYGPNLKGWGATQTLEAIVRAIAEPSAEIALGYKGTEVVLNEGGGVIHGIAFNNNDHDRKNPPPLVIQSAGGVTQLAPKDRIEKKRAFKQSLIYAPATLQLKAQDIADIAAWLKRYR